MKGSVITSVVLHGLLLAWLLVSFGSVEPFEVTASEALPVELVPLEELTQLQEGDKTAPKKEQAAKQQTQKEDKIENAVNAGDNNFDLKSVPTPVEKPDNVQKQATLEKSDNDSPVKDVKPVEIEEILKEETQVEPATELAAKAEPKVDVKPEPRPDVEPSKEKPVEAAEDPVPDNVPVPVARPEVAEIPKEVKKEEKKEEAKPKKVEEKKEKAKPVEVAEAKTAKTQDRKKDEKNKKTAKSTTSKEADVKGQELNDLLSKVEQEVGGAKRNKNNKAFGADKNTGGQKLSQTETDALMGIIEKNWTIMPGQVTSSDIKIVVRFELDESGEIIGRPEVSGTGAEDSALRALEGGAVRAVMKSAPFDKLPKDKYETWKVVELSFYPNDMM